MGNFISAAVAVDLMNHLKSLEHDDQEWQSLWSTCQGVYANVERYRNSPLMHGSIPADCKPTLYDMYGFQVQFPAPTKHIPKPRIHYSKHEDTASKSVACVSSRTCDAKKRCCPGKKQKK